MTTSLHLAAGRVWGSGYRVWVFREGLRRRGSPGQLLTVMKSISFCLVPFLVLSATVPAADTGFPERFALAADRGAVLKELIPGTDDYYYYHALHLQHQGKKAELGVLLGEWENRFQQANARRNEIRNRQVLLDYGTDPAGSLEYLRNKLGVSYNHQRVTPDARPDLATSLDPALVTREAFLADALRGTDALGNVTTSGLVHVMRNDGVELTTARRRDLLNRIHRPDFPRLVAVVSPLLLLRCRQVKNRV